jgi:hypothetical protein
MAMRIKYEIQQDNANCWRVIRTGLDGVRRAWDCPPCATKTEAREVIRQARDTDREEYKRLGVNGI